MRGEGFSLDDVSFATTRTAAEGDALDVRLTARAALPHVGFARTDRPTDAPEPASHRDVWWDGTTATPTPVYAASDVEARHARIAGPAIVAGDITTVCVPPGWALERDAHDQQFLTREA
jgi:N-methylhydantoinase A